MTTTSPDHVPADHDLSGVSLDERIGLLSGADYWNTRAVPAAGIPALMLSDGPHGIRAQYEGGDNLGLAASVASTCFPTAVTLAASWSPELVREVGAAVGAEARALGVDVVLGPGLNLKRHPFCGRNFEYYSEDPLVSGLLAAAAVEGIQSQGAGACVKHFAVNNQEGYRYTVDAIVDERTLRELYLRGFERAVRAAAPATVMAAYNLINGEHATDSHRLLSTILRDEWGFDGVVMSDWGAEADRVAGVAAGMDLEMPGGADTSGDVRAAHDSGLLTAEQIATAAGRVAALSRRLERARATVPASTMDALLEPHDALARRAAAQSTVVLRNEADVLPLTPGARIALIGAFADTPRYQGSGSSLVTPTRLTTALEALRDAGFDVTSSPGYEPERSGDDPALIAAAVEVARGAETAVVMVGLPPIAESEGFDRETLALPPQHDALVRAVAAVAQRTVVVLSLGSAVQLPWRDEVDAILVTHLGGQASGGAVADVLLGTVEPAGRLTETWFASVDDIAATPFFPGTPHQVQYREGVFVGYRHATTAGVAVPYPFGAGLGYGRTRWSDASLSGTTIAIGGRVTVSVAVENVGPRPTTELVQVYLHDTTGVVLRPRRELVGFARATLAPGERRVVEVPVAADDLRFWDVRSNSWQLPTGQAALEVARDAATVEAVLPVVLEGTVIDSAEPPASEAIAVSDAAFERRLGRSIPGEPARRPYTRDTTLAVLRRTLAGKLLWLGIRSAAKKAEDAFSDEVSRAMYERTVQEMPIRGLAQLTSGQVSWGTVDAVVALANRRPFAALRHALRRPPR